jgi:HSP20 family protein
MSELILWKKQELDKLRRDMDQLFRRFRRGFGVPGAFLEVAEAFRTELSETEEKLVLRAELPGIKAEEIQISVTEDTLNVKAESSEEVIEKGDDFHRIAKSSRSFSRSITLPCRIVSEEVRAAFKDNILSIELPKCKPKKALGVRIETR